MIVTELLVLLVLVLINGVLAGSEIAVLALREGKLRDQVRRGNRGAIAVETLRSHPERFLATVQIGITVIGAAAGAFGGASIAAHLAPSLTGLFGDHAGAVAFGLVIAFVAWLSLIFGELVPKSMALRFAGRYAYVVARPLLWLSSMMRPLVWFLTACSNLVLRVFGDRTTFTEARLSRDELQQLVADAGRTGSLDASSSEIAGRALGFGEVTVAEVMVPRDRVVALRRGAPADEVQRVILEEGHSRMPVHDDNLDAIVGYVIARDVLAVAWERGLVVLEDILRPVYTVTVATRAVDVLRELQRRRVQLAVIVDEHGGLAGIVTIEDLVEELVGDIFSEDEQPMPMVTREPDGTALVPGWAPVRKVNRELHLDLPVGADRTTITGLCMALAESIPEAGERLTTDDGTVLEVVQASSRRVRQVRIHPGLVSAH